MNRFQTLLLVSIVSSYFVSGVVNGQSSNRRYVLETSQAGFRVQDDEVESKRDVMQDIDPLRKPMSSLSVDVREFSTDAPSDRSSNLTASRPDSWSSFSPAPIGYAWAAPNIRYQPLFFENVRLERYGQTRGPWLEVGDSAFHFFTSAALLPYHARFDHIRECDYPLGFCRPGNEVRNTRQLHFWGW